MDLALADMEWRARDIVDPITKDISVDFYQRLTVDRFYEWLTPRYKKTKIGYNFEELLCKVDGYLLERP